MIEANGHDVAELYAATRQAVSNTDAPTVIIAETVKGKGVSFMENNNAWHHGHLSEEQYEQAIKEISDGNQ